MSRNVRNADVAIVGAGAAGLNAALVLGRARRSVVVFDDLRQRNTVAEKMHGFIAHDGLPPGEFLRIARRELEAYQSVTFVTGRVTRASRRDAVFDLALENGESFAARRILLATGLTDALPPIDGLNEFWGTSAFVCPYCDAWEVRDRRIVVCGDPACVVGLAQELYQWSADVAVAGVPDLLAADDADWLRATGIHATRALVRAARGRNGAISELELSDGSRLPCDALFLAAKLHQHSEIARHLGCELTADEHIRIDECSRTSVRGVYAAGDATTKHHQVVIAAASGARAAICMNDDLTCEDVAETVRSERTRRASNASLR